MVMTHTLAKGQGPRSLGLKIRVEKDGWSDGRTDGDDCITGTSRAKMVDNNRHVKSKDFPYSLPSVGPGTDPGLQAVSPPSTRR